MKGRLTKLVSENRTFIIFLALMFLFRGAIADWNEVPTGSMQPTIVEGDRIWVDKLAYDLRIPLTHISLHRFADPQRGDVVVFDSAASGKTMVKRVIGMPGDSVAMVNNHLVINGQAADYQLLEDDSSRWVMIEQSLAGQHTIAIQPDIASPMASFPEVVVPEGQYLVLGDNRDNSADSRYYGFIPRDEIIGRSSKIVLSLNYDNYYLPRGERWFKVLN